MPRSGKCYASLPASPPPRELTTSEHQIRFPVAPRDVPPVKAARRLHLTLAQFELVLPELLARGFPKPNPTTNMFDLVAIGVWMDTRSGINLTTPLGSRDASDGFAERLGRLRNGQ